MAVQQIKGVYSQYQMNPIADHWELLDQTHVLV